MKPSAENRSPRRRSRGSIVGGLAAIASVLAAIATLAAVGARWSRLCELTTHFPLQIAMVSVLACLILALKRWKLALLAGVVAAVNVAYLTPFYWPGDTRSVADRTCRAVSANVRTSNPEKDSVIDFIRETQPDLFLLMEVNDDWIKAFAALENEYPYSVKRPQPDNFGIALYSRLPITSHRVENLTNVSTPTIIATVDFFGRDVQIVGTHPVPPVGRGADLRNRHLQALGQLVAELPPGPLIVLGDLNATSWSPYFKDLLEQGGLQDTRRGVGLQPTWPNLPWPLRIPIDHALVRPDCVVTDRYVGPDVGSDHRPIVVEFGLK